MRLMQYDAGFGSILESAMVKLESYLAGHWQAGSGEGEKLTDPVTG